MESGEEGKQQTSLSRRPAARVRKLWRRLLMLGKAGSGRTAVRTAGPPDAPQTTSHERPLLPVELNEENFVELSLRTAKGDLCVRYYPPGKKTTGAGIIWAGGVGGGFDSPGVDLYHRAARYFQDHGTASVRVQYRNASDFEGAIADVLFAVKFLAAQDVERVFLVGHSFGGAVVITAGALSPLTAGVCALSTQSFGTEAVSSLAPKPLLLIHGTADTVLPAACSEEVFARAGEPRDLVLVEGGGHVLEESRDEVFNLVKDWLTRRLTPGF